LPLLDKIPFNLDKLVKSQKWDGTVKNPNAPATHRRMKRNAGCWVRVHSAF
jgi:hypothetical protein